MTVRDDLCRAVWLASEKKRLIMRVDVTDPKRVTFRFSHRHTGTKQIRKRSMVTVPEAFVQMFIGEQKALAALIVGQVEENHEIGRQATDAG